MPAFCTARDRDIPGGLVLGAVFRGQPQFVSAGESYGAARLVFFSVSSALLTHNVLCNARFRPMHLWHWGACVCFLSLWEPLGAFLQSEVILAFLYLFKRIVLD